MSAPQTEKIRKIQASIEWIEENLKGNTPIHEIFASRSPKKDLIQKWAQYLEELAKMGIYKQPISTISSHITERMTNLGLPTDYVREVLSVKYKQSSTSDSNINDDNNGEKPREISSKPKKENKELIRLAKQEIKFWNSVIKKLSKKPFLSKIDGDLTEEIMLKWNNLIDSAVQALDERNEVPHTKQFLFLFAKSQTTLGNTYSLFVRYYREFAELTTKQAGKILRGESKYLDPMYEPKDRQEARHEGFYGFPCERCGSFRTRLKWNDKSNNNEIKCFKCGEWSPPKTIPLPKD